METARAQWAATASHCGFIGVISCPFVSIRGLPPLLFEQLFSNLNGIERRAFEELVARDPESQAVFERAIAAQTAHGAIILVGLVQRLRILILRRTSQLAVLALAPSHSYWLGCHRSR